MATDRRNYKDSFFRIIFGEKHKENALALYNALNKSNYTNVEDLEMYTIDDAIYMTVKNDVAYLFDDSMNLIEHQSTCNPNMPLRGLTYFSELYSRYIVKRYGRHDVVFRTWTVRIPTPHYYVFYNGSRDMPKQLDLHLSDAYEGKGDLEVTAHVLNINCGKNGELFEACEPLANYSEVVKRVRENLSGGMTNEEAVKAAIETSINDGIFVDILTSEVSEVSDSFLAALTRQELEELQRDEIEHSREAGLAEGREEAHETDAKLFECMKENNRLEDYVRALTDPEFRKQLISEYGL